MPNRQKEPSGSRTWRKNYTKPQPPSGSTRLVGHYDLWWNHSQQAHTEPPLLLESAATRPVLYTIGVVGFVLFSWWWAWWCPKHVETPINTSSFLHLVGYLFTFMIQDARSHEIIPLCVYNCKPLSSCWNTDCVLPNIFQFNTNQSPYYLRVAAWDGDSVVQYTQKKSQ
jgi:hypothetical protein